MTTISLRKDWYEAPSGTNYLITLTCGKADASDLLSHLSEVLEAALATQVRAVDAHRVVRAYWNRPVEARGDLGKLFESSSDAPGDESPGGWPLPISWGLFLASVTGLFFLIRACVS